MTNTAHQLFNSNADYIQQEAVLWMAPRSMRLGAEAEARAYRRDGDDQRAEQSDKRAAAAREAEDRGRAELDARLKVHRREGSFTLGLDKICEHHDLGPDARTSLLCMTICGVSPMLAEEVFDKVSLHLTITMSPEVIAKVLEARTVEDHLQVVQLFQPDSPLVRLIKMDGRHNPEIPEDIHNVTLRLLRSTFEIVLFEAA